MKNIFLLIISLTFSTFLSSATEFIALKSKTAVTIDGVADESCWDEATWYAIDQVWIPYGADVSTSDFTGRFKLSWSDTKLYLLAEIIDDSLSDDHSDMLDSYWEDDCLEAFIDEDASGGDHTYNFNAFAYHISTFYDVIDNNTSHTAEAFNDHINVELKKINDTTYIWEAEIDIYDDSYTSAGSNTPETLYHGKEMGFSLAYCDNDETTGRENFFGSTYVEASNYNDHWQNASLFGQLTLIDSALVEEPNSINTSVLLNGFFYPNPVKKGNTVYYSVNNNVNMLIECYNLAGEKILTSETPSINTASLPRGHYIVRVSSQNYYIEEQLIVR